MAKAKRVFELARELNVASKAVLEKCQAEGLELKNHMATVSIGLEATIRDWFSEDHTEGGGTAIETAKAVDLTKVKKAKARKKAKPPAEEPPADEPADEVVESKDDAEADVETEAPAESATKAASASGKAKAKPRPKPKPEPEVEPEPEPVAEAPEKAEEEPPAPPEDDDAKPDEPAEPEATDEPEAPAEDEAVKPAGPMLEEPTAAVLKGPKVIRVEAPEPDRRRGPRRGPGGPGGPNRSGPTGMPDLLPQTGPARGRGAGAPKVGGEDESSRSPRRKRGKGQKQNADVTNWAKGVRREQDLIEREARLNRATGYLKQRRRQMKSRGEGAGPMQSAAQTGGKVEISEPFNIKDLSFATGIKGAEIVKFLFQKGIMTTLNQTIGTELAMEICMEYDIDLVVKEARTAEDDALDAIAGRDREDDRRRPPVVAVLGHVDHGKTSLLDKIRSADVATGEAGGITQHIGAFRTTVKSGEGEDKTVVFLDTPGHAAFTNMRSRGATLADIVVVVVAADDGVMPQTIESIAHAKAAGIPIVVALNKIDVPQATEANITKILGQLAERELNPVEWGGETEVMKVSAMTGDGVKELIEVLDYQAELKELTADYAGDAYGRVIEAELDTGRGSVARVLVQEGELKVGDFIVIGRSFGKVRSMVDDRGNSLQVAGPATPVEISGIDDVPDAGDRMYATPTLAQAEQIATQKRDAERKKELAAKTKVTMDNVFEHIDAQSVKELRVVLKGDVQGSIEVLRATLEEQAAENTELAVRVLHAAVGGITESDVLLAEASDAIIIGFNVIASAKARSEAERRDVDIRLYRVIYDIVDDITNALEGMLSPVKREEVLGHAEVREVFKVSKVGAIAGCYVTDGTIRRNANIRVTRDDIVIEHDRTLEQLKRFKDDAKEVKNGMECGAKIEGYDDIRQGDILECYITTEEKAKLGG